MIPRSYPTLMDGRKAGYMQVFYLTSVTGLTKWIDYIPVKTVAFSATAEGTTNANGHISVTQVESSTARRKWVDYIPVFEDGSATVAWSTNANGYIPVNQILSMDFRSGILDSRITFTRADASTCATYFDSTGRLATMGRNELLWSQDMTNGAWTQSNTSASTSTVGAPLGSSFATAITGVGASATNKFFTQAPILATVGAYTVSVYLKAGTQSVVVLRTNDSTGSNGARQVFNISTGVAVGGVTTDGTATGASSSITSVGNGWYRCSVTCTYASNPVNVQLNVWFDQYGTSTSTNTYYVSAAQLELGSAANTYSATTTAANSGPRFDYDPATAAGVTGGELVTNGTFSDGLTGWSTAHTGASTVQIVGGVATWVTNGVDAGRIRQSITTVVGKNYRVTNTGGMGLAIGTTPGGQEVLAYGSSGDRYFTAQSTVTWVNTVSTINGITIDNVSVQEAVFTPRGLLIEESRANLLLWSRDMTNAAWTKTDTTPTQNQVGLDGTANSATLMTEGVAGTASSQQVGAVTAGSTITVSFVLKRGNTDWLRVRLFENSNTDGANVWFNLNTGAKGTASAAGAATAVSSTITSLGGGWYRCSVTCLPNGTYTNYLTSTSSASADNSTTRVNNATYIVGHSQLEVGAFATSPILTTSASLTRAADSASMTGTNFSSWFNASAGTFVVEGDTTDAATYNECFASIDNNTANNRIQLRRNSDNNYASFFVNDGGVSQALINTANNAWAPGVIGKLAGAYSANDFASSFLGGTVGTDVAGTVPAVTQMIIGNGLNSNYINGHIRRLTYYPTRLANATLQALTA